eukprot:TRINITY_DN43435_c0_g1_i1.p1 TRINITY_DN43435_c0_g1~~TRINITY_DN43435_c0_g1_i1.p1  ORF type:complete len:205 (+),score=25.44 TRINITY_DN43435_c0_g1_i1:249-863(+)
MDGFDSCSSASGASCERDDGRHTLVLDMDETLLHSSFEWAAADFVMPIDVDGERFTVYVRKRPHVEYFLRKCCEMFKVVVWTASIQGYAEPVIKKLLECAGVEAKVPVLYRPSCTLMQSTFIKDLSKLSPDLSRICIVDNSPAVAVLQPKNLIPITSWFSDVTDAALLDLLPFLERVKASPSIFDVLSRAAAVREPITVNTTDL